MMEFEEVALGDVCKISSSKRIFANEYKNNGIPFYRGKEIIEKHYDKMISNELFISEERYNEIKEKFGVPQSGDLLLTSVGTLGVPYIVRDEKFYFKDGNLTWFTSFNGIDSSYLYYWFVSPYGKAQIDSMAIGSTQKALTITTLSKFTICLPSLSDQCRIASILSSLDKKIETNNKINANLEEMAQAIFKNWFVDFAPFKDGKFVESELGMIPEGWRVGKAEDFYTINIGKTPPRSEKQCFSDTKENNKIWVSIADLGCCGTFIDNSKEYLTCDAQNKYNVSMVPAGSVLLSFKLTIGRVAIADVELTTNEAIARFLLSNDNYREFTYLYLKQYQYDNLGSTSSIATAVNSKIIKSMQFLMPTENVVNTFSNSVKPLFEKIRLNQQENARLASIRDTLLPRLMSGEIEV